MITRKNQTVHMWICYPASDIKYFCTQSLSHVWFYNPAGSSVHGISQARRLVWVARGCPGESSRPRDPSPLHLLHWQANSLPLCHLESPYNNSRCNWITIILGSVYHPFVLFLHWNSKTFENKLFYCTLFPWLNPQWRNIPILISRQLHSFFFCQIQH